MTAPRDAYHVLTILTNGKERVVAESTPEMARKRAKEMYGEYEELSIQTQRSFLQEMKS